MEDFVVIENLVKKFGNITAVDGVSFTARKGQVLGFLGPNGAGKSTTMRMITGYLPPSSGKITVCGHDVALEPEKVKRQVGYLPEGGPLYSDMTPVSFLRFVADVRGMSSARFKERFEYVVENLHLKPVLEQSIDTLSKGYKRRVALAQAILHDPDVLILDEPTDGLDPNQKHEVRELILAMASDKAIVISTHILEEVEAVCSRAIIIAKGKIVLSGTPSELAVKSPEYNAVIVEFISEDGVEDKLRNALRQIDDVASVKSLGLDKLEILPASGKNILPSVSKKLLALDTKINSIYNMPGQLDQAFRKVTLAKGEEQYG